MCCVGWGGINLIYQIYVCGHDLFSFMCRYNEYQKHNKESSHPTRFNPDGLKALYESCWSDEYKRLWVMECEWSRAHIVIT